MKPESKKEAKPVPVSLGTFAWNEERAEITQVAETQLCAQLYAIRTETARDICLSRDLATGEDGLIKALVYTDSLTHEIWPRHLKLAQGAEHLFEAYTSPVIPRKIADAKPEMAEPKTASAAAISRPDFS